MSDTEVTVESLTADVETLSTDFEDMKARVAADVLSLQTLIADLQDQIDNGIKPNLTGLRDRIRSIDAAVKGEDPLPDNPPAP